MKLIGLHMGRLVSLSSMVDVDILLQKKGVLNSGAQMTFRRDRNRNRHAPGCAQG